LYSLAALTPLTSARLRYVAGITERTALNIVTFRKAAGFLRIRSGDNPLDMTAVHPESYQIVEQIAQSLSGPIEELIKNPRLLEKVDRNRLSAGSYTQARCTIEI
jgi:uncharacterized protein